MKLETCATHDNEDKVTKLWDYLQVSDSVRYKIRLSGIRNKSCEHLKMNVEVLLIGGVAMRAVY